MKKMKIIYAEKDCKFQDKKTKHEFEIEKISKVDFIFDYCGSYIKKEREYDINTAYNIIIKDFKKECEEYFSEENFKHYGHKPTQEEKEQSRIDILGKSKEGYIYVWDSLFPL